MKITKNHILLFLLTIQFLFLSYDSILALFAEYFNISLLKVIYKIIFETNVVLFIFYSYILLSQSFTYKKILIHAIFFYIYLFIMTFFNIFYYRYFGYDFITFLLIPLIHIGMLFFLKRQYKVTFNLKLLFIINIFFIVLLFILSCFTKYEYNRLVNNCMDEHNIEKINKCIIKLDYIYPLFSDHRIYGPNVVKIFQHNPTFRKQAEKFNGLSAYRNKNNIVWLPKHIETNFEKFPE